MDNVYEIIFEKVYKYDLYDFVRFIEKSAKSCTGLYFGGKVLADRGQIETFLSCNTNTRLIEKLYCFKVIDGICLPFVWLSVLKYGAAVDVELSFYSVSSIEIHSLMHAMQRYAAAASEEFHVTGFYGGVEPALDVNTRYFTGNDFGPLGRLRQ